MNPKLPYELRMKIWKYRDNGYKNKDIRWFYCRQAHYGTETTTHDDREKLKIFQEAFNK